MKIQVLDEAKIEKIKSLTEDIIENIGIRVDDEALRELAGKRGAKIEGSIVKLSRALLRELISTVPKSYTVSGVAKDEYTVGDTKQKILGIVTDPYIIDYDTKQLRLPGLEDVRINTILNQKHEMVYSMSRMDFPVTEYADATSTWRALETHLLNHTKHYTVLAANDRDFNTWTELVSLFSDKTGIPVGKLITAGVPTMSPLALVDINCSILKQAVKHGCPVVPTTCPMAGTTSPYSVEGTLLMSNAEVIFLAAMTQLIKPGNPFLYAAGASVSDMRTGHDMYYTFDKVLWKGGSVELAKHYGIPCTAEMGGTLGHRYDMQSGAESFAFMLGAVNSGADVIAGLGSCCNANGLSSEMIVIQSEWLRAAKYLTSGLCEERIERAYKSLADQGPGGSFIMDDLTIEMLYSDGFFKGDVMDVSGGYERSKSMLEKSHDRVLELTSGYVSPVPEDIQEIIKRFFADIYKKILNV